MLPLGVASARNERPTHGMCGSLARLLRSLLLTALVAVCAAQATIEDIKGKYTKITGECERSITFLRSAPTLRHSDFKLSGVPCQYGKIEVRVASDPNRDGSKFTQSIVKERELVGDSLVFRISEAIRCQNLSRNGTISKADSGEYTSFVKPKNGFKAVWATVFGTADTTLGKISPAYVFRKGVKHIVVSSLCVYRESQSGAKTSPAPKSPSPSLSPPPSSSQGSGEGAWLWGKHVLSGVVGAVGAIIAAIIAGRYAIYAARLSAARR